MSSYLDSGYAERCQMESAIHEYSLLLERISEERFHLTVKIAECNLVRKQLITRRLVPRAGAPVKNRSRNGIQRRANHWR